MEQEPIKIEIPVEEEEPPVMVPERARPGKPMTEKLTETGRDVADKARSAWESERRQMAQDAAKAGLRKGARASRVGAVRGLHWLSDKLADLADRFTPPEKSSG